MSKNVSLILILSLLFAFTINAQTVTVTPYGVSPRDAAKDLTDIFDKAYSGLTNVGKQTQMYISAKKSVKLTGAQTWAVTTKPAGSVAVIGAKQAVDSTGEVIVFTPDIKGKFVVTFTDGSLTGTITINSGVYLGNTGGTVGCVSCHSNEAAKWNETGHASGLDRGFDGLKGDHFGPNCVSCHSTGYDANANNQGFDDFPFVFPDTLFVGQAANMKTLYPDAMQRANIQCEACHGPGSEHMGAVADNKMVSMLDSKVCAVCHDAGTHHVYPAQFDISKHGNGGRIYAQNTSTDRSSCMPCHNGAGFIASLEGKPQTEKQLIDITCATCHDPHNNDGGNHQLRAAGDYVLPNGEVITEGGYGKLCMNCHSGRYDTVERLLENSFGSHYGAQAILLSGKNIETFGYKLPSSPHLQIENSCVTCHMAPGHVDAENNVVLVGSHSFRVNFLDGTDNVAICQDCHGDVGTDFDQKKYFFNGDADHDGDGIAEGTQIEVHGLLDNLAMLLHPVGSLTMTTNDPAHPYNQIEKTAFYNHDIVRRDHSYGIHNPAFTVALLKVSIEALKYGAISAGAIQSVMDIPMDQGFQVRLVWTAFGSDDGVAMDQVKSYTILRKVSDPTPGAPVTKYSSMKQIPSTVTVGTTIMLEGELWDIVSEVAAIQYMEYATVVPTLHNGVTSTFKVLGKTEGGMVAETAPMGGMSVDNLAPVKPNNVAAIGIGTGIELTWDESADKDLKHFELYRSQTQGFTPSVTNMISTATVNSFVDNSVVAETKYYYVVAAIDYSGNISDFSNEVSAIVTDVRLENGIPTKYALDQNYPNPFNPSTSIKFSIPEASNVKLTVFDITGREVAVLVNKSMGAGYYNVDWDASNLSSGIYIYQIETGSFTNIKKMVLLK